MKKVKVLLVLLVVGFYSYAQLGPYAGANFAYNSTWLMNKQVFDHGSQMDPVASFGSYFGLVAGYKFNDEIGLEVNININNINQKHEGRLSEVRYTSETNLRALDIPILGRFGTSSYFEIGPVIQMLNVADYRRTFESEGENLNYKDTVLVSKSYEKSVLEHFSTTNFAIALGFGSNIDLIPEELMLSVGFRFQYTISDMEGINGLGKTKDSEFVPEIEKDTFYNNALLGGFRIGITYFFM